MSCRYSRDDYRAGKRDALISPHHPSWYALCGDWDYRAGWLAARMMPRRSARKVAYLLT